jgi:hypothetical protein
VNSDNGRLERCLGLACRFLRNHSRISDIFHQKVQTNRGDDERAKLNPISRSEAHR